MCTPVILVHFKDLTELSKIELFVLMCWRAAWSHNVCIAVHRTVHCYGVMDSQHMYTHTAPDTHSTPDIRQQLVWSTIRHNMLVVDAGVHGVDGCGLDLGVEVHGLDGLLLHPPLGKAGGR